MRTPFRRRSRCDCRDARPSETSGSARANRAASSRVAMRSDRFPPERRAAVVLIRPRARERRSCQTYQRPAWSGCPHRRRTAIGRAGGMGRREPSTQRHRGVHNCDVGPTRLNIPDARGRGATLRVTRQPGQRRVVFSHWRDGRCVASTPIELGEVPELIGVLVDALGVAVDMGNRPPSFRPRNLGSWQRCRDGFTLGWRRSRSFDPCASTRMWSGPDETAGGPSAERQDPNLSRDPTARARFVTQSCCGVQRAIGEWPQRPPPGEVAATCSGRVSPIAGWGS